MDGQDIQDGRLEPRCSVSDLFPDPEYPVHPCLIHNESHVLLSLFRYHLFQLG